MVSLVSKEPVKVRYLSLSTEVVGQRLDNFLITTLKGVPKTRIYRGLRKGEFRINKGRVGPDYRVQGGDILRIPPLHQGEIPAAPVLSSSLANTLEQAILYEDDSIIVLNKPSGLASHGGSGLKFGAIEALRQLSPKHKTLELVHRLDRDTSGCLVLAKRKSVLRELHEQFQAGKIKKRYIALVSGKWSKNTLVEAALLKNRLSSGERIVKVDERGGVAKTFFRVLKCFREASLVEAELITGKTHQIRVHAAYKNHPIAMDDKYGDKAFNLRMKERGLKRLFLHAKYISFTHPKTGERLNIEAPLPDELTAVLKRLTGEPIDV